MGIVPPKIDSPRSFIGVGTRELAIIGTGLILAILSFISPLPTIPKTGLIVVCLSLSLYIALARHPVTGNTVEAHLLDIYHFYKRERFMQRGAGSSSGDYTELLDSFFDERAAPESYATKDTKGLVIIRPFDLKWSGFFNIFSFSFLVMLILWVWTGGLQELLLRFGIF